MSEHGRVCLCFPCRRERKRLADPEWAGSRSDLAAGLPSPKQEARALLALIQGHNGGTEKAIEEVRELIAVPQPARLALLAYCRKHPEARHGICKVLKFRERVGEEFERLVERTAPGVVGYGQDAAGGRTQTGGSYEASIASPLGPSICPS